MIPGSDRLGRIAIDRPILIVGVGRSGTTLFLRMLGMHPSTAWFSNLTNQHPSAVWTTLFSRVLDLPVIGDHVRYGWRMTPKPRESVAVLNYVTNNTFTLPRELSAADVTAAVRDCFQDYVRRVLWYQGKPRFLHKHTGFARTEYLSAIFPDALFIHIVRDGRAVAHSLQHVRWWDGTLRSWWWGPMNPLYEEEYEASGRHPLVLGGIVWKTLMEGLTKALAGLPSHRALTLRYEHLVERPLETVQIVADFCALPRSTRFERRIRAIPIRAADHKWRRDLTGSEVALLERCLSADLTRYGFLP